MIEENRLLVTNEPVEVQDCRKFTAHLKGMYIIFSDFTKENWRMSTCHRLDLQTLGSQPVMPKSLPDHLCELALSGQVFYMQNFPLAEILAYKNHCKKSDYLSILVLFF